MRRNVRTAGVAYGRSPVASWASRDGTLAGAVALPTMAGRANFGAFGNVVCSTWVMVKPASLNGVERRAVAVTADDEPVDPVYAVLEPSQLGVGGTHMLDEQQLATGTQHPAQLPQCPRLVVHPAQHQRRDRYVEGAVIEGQILRRCAQDRGCPRRCADLLL